MLTTPKRHALPVDGMQLSYLHEGQGTPFIMIHGLMGNAVDFTLLIGALLDRYACYAPDVRGFSMSRPEDPGDVGLEQAVDDVLALLERAAPDETAHLIGHSFGGVIALEAAARAPGRFGTITLVATPVGRIPLLPLVLPLYPLAIPLLTKKLVDFYALNFNISPKNRTPELDQMLLIRNKYISRVDAVNMGVYFGCMADWSPPHIPNAGELPALLVQGGNDPLVGKSNIEKVKKILPNLESHIIPGTAHAPHYEKPDVFNEILRNFLGE